MQSCEGHGQVFASVLAKAAKLFGLRNRQSNDNTILTGRLFPTQFDVDRDHGPIVMVMIFKIDFGRAIDAISATLLSDKQGPPRSPATRFQSDKKAL
jgi:hypothetical protein